MAVFGDLSTMSLCDLLQWASLTQQTGVLELERDKICRRIEFRKGWIGACSTDDPPARLGQFLLARGKINKKQLREALATQEVNEKHLGLILMEMGLITQAELGRQVAAKAEETIQGLFDWEDAVFRFYEGATLDPNQMEVSLSVSDILMRGVQHHDELNRMRTVFTSSGMVLRRTERPAPGEVLKRPMARRIFESVDGNRTLGEILLHAHASEFLVIKLLFRLHQLGLVEIAETREVNTERATLLDPARAKGFKSLAWEVSQDGPVPPGDSSTIPDTQAGSRHPGLRPFNPNPTTTELSELDSEVEVASRLMARGEYEAALELLNASYRANPAGNHLRRLIAKAESAYIEAVRREDLSGSRVPRKVGTAERDPGENLRSEELYLLTLIDGMCDVKSILWLAPLREVDALKGLRGLLEKGLIELVDGAAEAPEAADAIAVEG